MKTVLRLRLEMGARAAAFCKAHPDSNPATAQVAAKLIELSTRAEGLLSQHRGGAVTATTAVADKATLRDSINADLRALMTISRQAARDNPEITVHRRIPPTRSSGTEFYTTAVVAVSEATQLKQVLTPYGLSDELLASLTQGLDAWKAVTERKRGGLGSKVGAGADLEAVSRDIIGVVASLDAVHAVRFKTSPALLAEWKSVRDIPWPGQHQVDAAPPAPAVPATPAVPPVPLIRVEDNRAA